MPHNWDDYHGYRQLVHGNLHGAALYTKDFIIRKKRRSRRYFLYFEGIGTYATVKVNGQDLGRHPVGRTTLTLDATDALGSGRNTVEVLAEHPSIITDMPWICGGCSSEWGFSEGSQPLGIYRPVRLVITDEIRIEPFGVHIWNNTTADSVFIETEIKNYGKERADFEYTGCFHEADGRKVAQSAKKVSLEAGKTKVISQAFAIDTPRLWNPGTPYLYYLSSTIKKRGRIIDEVNTPYGICTYSWPAKRGDGDGRFYFNGKPVFINGTCEYGHLFGNSHAFSEEQIDARVKMIRNAGFNAVRDAHQPHNLRYLQHWDRTGMMFWLQFSSHVWYDTPEFRQNFKQLLRQWIKERRNSPSVIAWGLQNESTLPTDFAKECTEIIREMDPMAREMRVVTTCNGGSGTDCKGLRIFDVAINGTTVINDLDIWAEAGHDKVLKKVLECDVSGGCLTIDFPEVKAGQAVISAIAIATKAPHVHADIPQETSEWNWETADRDVVAKLPADKMPKEENTRATTTYKAKDATCTGLFTWRDDNGEKTASFKGTGTIEWTFTVGLAQTYVFRFGFMNQSGKPVIAHINVMDQDGNIVREGEGTFPVTSGRWNNINTTTGGFINTGTYKVSLSLPDGVDIAFKSLDIQ